MRIVIITSYFTESFQDKIISQNYLRNAKDLTSAIFYFGYNHVSRGADTILPSKHFHWVCRFLNLLVQQRHPQLLSKNNY